VLSQRPDVILADEPIASLDPRSARIVLDTLRTIHESRSIPIILNLHQVDMAREYAGRIIGMNRGRLVFDGPPSALDEHAVRALYSDAPDTRTDHAGTNEVRAACGA